MKYNRTVVFGVLNRANQPCDTSECYEIKKIDKIKVVYRFPYQNWMQAFPPCLVHFKISVLLEPTRIVSISL